MSRLDRVKGLRSPGRTAPTDQLFELERSRTIMQLERVDVQSVQPCSCSRHGQEPDFPEWNRPEFPESAGPAVLEEQGVPVSPEPPVISGTS